MMNTFELETSSGQRIIDNNILEDISQHSAAHTHSPLLTALSAADDDSDDSEDIHCAFTATASSATASATNNCCFRLQLSSALSWLPDGYSKIFRLYVFGPSGLKDYGSAMLHCKM